MDAIAFSPDPYQQFPEGGIESNSWRIRRAPGRDRRPAAEGPHRRVHRGRMDPIVHPPDDQMKFLKGRVPRDRWC